MFIVLRRPISRKSSSNHRRFNGFLPGETWEKGVVKLDEERRASMVSNLLVVLCGETEATPVINTGTLYQ
jgi:hypothetical protein